MSGRIFIPLALLIFAFIFPPEFFEKLPKICLIKFIFGRCPADGTLRSLSSLLHGDLHRAITYNPNSLLLLPICLYIVLKETFSAVLNLRK